MVAFGSTGMCYNYYTWTGKLERYVYIIALQTQLATAKVNALITLPNVFC